MRVCVVSTASGLAGGGIPGHVGCLTDALAARCDVSAVARFAVDPPFHLDYAAWEAPRVVLRGHVQTTIVRPRKMWMPALRTLRRFLDRPGAQPVAIEAFTRAYAPAIAEAVPDAIDVVHVVGSGRELLGFAARRVARQRGAALVVSPFVHAGVWGDGELDLDLYRSADALVVATRFERTHLASLGVAPDRISVSGLGPNASSSGVAERFRSRHGLGRRPIVLSMGRRQRYKGYHALCGAMERVLRTAPDACLVAIGAASEPPFPSVPEDHLLDLGEVSEADKADALAACDVLCVPSEGESFGLVYVEAWAYGKPVVVGPAPPARELVTDCEGGLCCDNDEGSIAEALSRLLGDPTLRERLGRNGRDRQRREFTWDAAARRQVDAYREALLRCGRGPVRRSWLSPLLTRG